MPKRKPKRSGRRAPEPEPGRLTTRQASAILKCTPRRVVAMIQEGIITARKVGKGWAIDRATMEREVKANAIAGGRGGKREGAGRPKRQPGEAKPSAEEEAATAKRKAEVNAVGLSRAAADAQDKAARAAINTLKYERLRSNLWDAHAVRLAWSERFDRARRVLEDLPEPLAADICAEMGLNTDQQTRMTDFLRDRIGQSIETLASLRFDAADETGKVR